MPEKTSAGRGAAAHAPARPTAPWPDGYRDWEGSFDDMVEVLCEVLPAAGAAQSPLTASSLRHYQNIGAVGRGRRAGKAAVFGFRELAQVVAVKRLLTDSWSLPKVAEIVPQLPTEALLDFSPSKSGAPSAPTSAVSVVERLRREAGTPEAAPRLVPDAAAIPRFAGRSVQPQALMAASPIPPATAFGYVPHGPGSAATPDGSTLQILANSVSYHRPERKEVVSLVPAPWLNALVDRSALQGLSDHQVRDTLTGLASLIQDERSRK